MGDNPKWLKRKVRARMAETGEKYTTALRAITKEIERMLKCPECEQGKHENCDGQAWDFENDKPTRCGCEVNNHGR